MEKLFTNYNEYVDFLNAIAHRRIKKLDRSKTQYEDEINEVLEKAGKIFEQFGSRINFIQEIIDVEIKIQNDKTNNQKDEFEDVNLKRESLYNKFNQFLEQLPLDEREDLEFYFKKILDRRLRANQTGELITQIKNEYPAAEDLTVIEIMEQPTFKKINSFLNEKTSQIDPETETDNKIEETNNLPYVVQIKEAPASLFEIEKEEYSKEQQEKQPQEIKSFASEELPQIQKLEISDLFSSSIEPKEALVEDIFPSFDEAIEFNALENNSAETSEDKDVNIDNTFNVFDSLNKPEESPTIEPKTEVEDVNTYEMEIGDSLVGLSTALIDDENGWYDIFEANKDLLIKRLEASGLTKDDPFQYNEEIFAGLTLIIPNVYEKSQIKALAA